MSLDTWGGGLPSAAESADCDAWLCRVMQSAKNKAMIARLEDSLHVFVSDQQQTQLPFPPRSAFHRKVCYLVARRYGLAHRLEEHVEPVPAKTSTQTQAVRLVLLKTPHSAIPGERLAQLADRPIPADLAKEQQMPKLVAPPVQKEAADDEQQDRNRAPQISTTFLRRPRSADGKTAPTTKAVPTAAPGSAAATLKSISEEDYRKARARIFKNAAANPDGTDPSAEQSAPTSDPARVVKIGVLAKGPVEGTTGFDRRRNRRSASLIATHSNAPDNVQNNSSTEKADTSKLIGPTDTGTHQNRQATSQSRGSKEGRGGQDQATKQGSSAIASGVATSANGAFATPASNGNRRTNPSYPSSDRSQIDRQDPDFDRRYQKWAVRAPPPPTHPPQQIPVPIFSQLLYPYAVQATAPHVHPSPLHVRSVNDPGGQVQQANANQYHSVHMHHPPAGAMMFQHFGQGVGGLTAAYSVRDMGVSDHISPYDVPPVDRLNASHSREMSSLQHQGVPPQLTRNSPTYGLDSKVDFPPLP